MYISTTTLQWISPSASVDIHNYIIVIINIIYPPLLYQVSDGAHRPQYKAFTIVIAPQTLDVANLTFVGLLQGDDHTYLNSGQLGLATNADRADITIM